MNIHLQDNGKIEITDFNAVQAFKIARKMEKDGIEFYTSLLTATDELQIKDAMRYLLESEKDHLDFFDKQLEIVSDEIGDGFEEDDIVDFVDSKVFAVDYVKEEKKEPRVLPKTIEALQLGLKIELRSIAFYETLMGNVQDVETKNVLNTIINEEKKHAEQLKIFI